MILDDIKEKYNCDKVAIFLDDKNKNIFCLIKGTKIEVINEKNETIGHLYYEVLKDDLIYLRNIEINQEYQSKKIGSKVLDLFEEIVVKDGDKKVYGIFEPKNTRANKFYKHKGYDFIKVDKYFEKNSKLNFLSLNEKTFISEGDVLLSKILKRKDTEKYIEYDDYYISKNIMEKENNIINKRT